MNDSPSTANATLAERRFDACFHATQAADIDMGCRAPQEARQITGEGDLNKMTQYQLKTLVSIMMGRAV